MTDPITERYHAADKARMAAYQATRHYPGQNSTPESLKAFDAAEVEYNAASAAASAQAREKRINGTD